jgi:hypothetical protein
VQAADPLHSLFLAGFPRRPHVIHSRNANGTPQRIYSSVSPSLLSRPVGRGRGEEYEGRSAHIGRTERGRTPRDEFSPAGCGEPAGRGKQTEMSRTCCAKLPVSVAFVTLPHWGGRHSLGAAGRG